MGKIVMPKNSALLNEIESVLKIYYEADDWLANDVYKARLKRLIGDDQYSSSYTKKAQITSYFGFTIWQDINNPQSLRKITASGKKMYEALQRNDTDAVQEVLMEAMENVKFGRDNYGCPESDSDIEPPALFVRAIMDLGYLTYREFAWLLWKLEDLGANYTDSLKELRGLRSHGQIQLGEETNKYADCKPIMILVRWGFLAEDDATNASNGKHIIIAKSVREKYENRLKNLKIYNIDKNVSSSTPESTNSTKNVKAQGGTNKIFYGAPGCGKSHRVSDILAEASVAKDNIIRVTFHPEYANCDFIGQILPTVETKADGTTGEEKEIVKYIFNPGPFTLALQTAYDTGDMVYLIIEEINRGNAAAIFGDMFQLLDRVRDSNKPNFCASEYPISNPNMQKYLISSISDETIKEELKDGIFIPSNLTIYATMNSSDQNVFTLDTAFKRRWSFEQISNDITKDADHAYKGWLIPGTTVTWADFLTKLNLKILDYKLQNQTNEDKRLGKYFVTRDCLVDPANAPGNVSEIAQNFAYKVLEYIWNDVCKIGREEWFDTETYKTLEDLIEAFVNPEEGETPLSVFQNITF